MNATPRASPTTAAIPTTTVPANNVPSFAPDVVEFTRAATVRKSTIGVMIDSAPRMKKARIHIVLVVSQ